jgi:type I restriction enzyme S subunit
VSEGGVPSKLPEGWTWATLDEVSASVRNGIFVSRPGTEPDGVPILRIGAVRPLRLDLSDLRYSGQSAEGLRAADRLVLPGDLLFTRYNGNLELVGACASVPESVPLLTYPDKLIRVRVDRRVVVPEFVAYAFSWGEIRARVRKHVKTTAGQAGIAGGELKKIQIPVPPLEEQRRIVAALEEQLSRLDAAIGNAAKAVETADMLIHSIKARAVRDLSSRFPMTTLGNEIREPLRNGHSARAATGGTIRTLTLTAVTKCLFDDAHTKLTAADPARVSKLWLNSGDIFIQRSNTPDLVGTSALYEGPENWAIYPDLLIRVRTSDRLDPQFAHLMLSAPQTRHYYRSQAKGLAGSMPKIDQETILNTRIPLPDLGIQRQTVQAVAQVIERAGHAAATAEAYRAKSSALRRSLLAEAFAGRLVPQDPSDEPADALLARIRAGREAAGATNSRRRIPRRTHAQRKRTPDTAPAPDAPPPPQADAPALATATQPTLDLEIPS